MLTRKQSRASRALQALRTRAAVSYAVEGLEGRVLLSVVPNTTPLNTGSGAVKEVVQTLAKLQNLADEVIKVDNKLTSAIGKLPLVGDGIKNAIGGPNDTFLTLATTIRDALNTLHSAANITGVDLQNAIFTALGPSGANVLPSSVTTASQVPIVLEDLDGTAADAEQVDFNLELKGTLFSTMLNPDFDLGLPALGLSVNGTVQAQLTYDIHLDFAVNATDFFYIDLGKDNPEVSLSLAVTTPGLHAQGRLAFLQLDSTDGTAEGNTQLVGTISADLDVGGDHKLKATNLASLTTNSSLSADAKAELHLHNVVSFGGSAKFPSLQADLDLSWNLASASLNSGGVSDSSFGSEPDVNFHNIKLDLGSFFSKFVTPIVDEVKTVLKPIQPLVDLLNTRIPIFSDIGFLKGKFDTNGDGKVSLLEVIDFFNGGSTKFLDTIVAVDNLVNSIPSLGGDVLIDLGAFELGGASNVNGADVRSLTDLTGVNLSTISANDIASELTSIGGMIGGDEGAKVAGFLGTLAQSALGGAGGDDGGGLHFPILENPASAFKLLLGQNVDLFTFDTPTLNLHSVLDEFFPILGPLGVELKGTVDPQMDFVQVKAHLSMGYDTQGLVDFVSSHNAVDLFDGFYVVDDPTKTFATASLGASAFAALDVIVASAGVGGGINGTVTFTVHDPENDGSGMDGRLRPKEIISDLQESPLCIFNIMGKITASLSAFIRVGIDTPFGFVGWSDNFDLGSTTLADFSFDCDSLPPTPPVLATLLGDGTLRLNMGPNAAARVNGDITDGDESFTVAHVSSQMDGTETVTVAAFGFTQTYSGVKKVYGEGGNGNDSIVLSTGVLSPAELYGDFNGSSAGNGDDTVTSADGPATIRGGGGNDQLSAGSGAANISGDDGNDLINGGAGADVIDGGNGDDNIFADGGNDTATGGAGDDYIDGGEGNDSLDGGADNDHLLGGNGNDTAVGGAGNDVVEGNGGDDNLTGGTGLDLLLGDNTTIVHDSATDRYIVTLQPGGGNDNIDAGDGNDSVYAGAGNDTVKGGNNDDYIQGNDGNDMLDGESGNDSVIGGKGDDAITGGTGNDILLGDEGDVSNLGIPTVSPSASDGNDAISGNDGNDVIYAEGGNDSVIGGQGNDFADGGAGNDIMLGDDGTITGSTYTAPESLTDGSDTFAGGDGNDIVLGQGGGDSVLGNGGDDMLSGGSGNDSMIGGLGNDAMTGDAGDDIMLGDNGSISGAVATLAPTASDGNDTMNGNAGADQMYGEGGADQMSGDADNDNMFGGDGNDTMNGNDGADQMFGQGGADLMFGGADNDLMSGGDENDVMYGQTGDDTQTGDAGDDYMEGNQGSDSMSGGTGDDDMIGGSSVANTPDAGDNMDGGDGADVMLGDNGIITRRFDSGGNLIRYTAANKLGLQNGAPIRDVTLFADSDVIGGNDFMTGGAGDDTEHGEAGNDSVYGNDGDDDLYGELGADLIDGGAGDDAIVGDKGIIVDSILDGSTQETISGQGNKVSVVIDSAGTKLRTVTLLDAANGGNDSISGGIGNDVIHAGAGDDLIYGDNLASSAADGKDAIFADAGNDVVYGGGADDNLFGGAGDDYLDGQAGGDIIYGGDGKDSLVADGSSDRLIDWFGNFNVFIVPGPGFGAPIIIRSPAPDMQQFLLDLAAADGSTDANFELQVVTPPSPSNSGPGGQP
jgi:Ca2+-binding RTX toxin-like protein